MKKSTRMQSPSLPGTKRTRLVATSALPRTKRSLSLVTLRYGLAAEKPSMSGAGV